MTPRLTAPSTFAPVAAASAVKPPIFDKPIRRIGVFRALMLGDLLCAIPALRTLRAAFPEAEITLIGLGWAHVLASRLQCVDHFIAFPGFPGLPEIPFDRLAFPGFLDQVHSAEFDLMIQLHGSGTIVNPLVATFGARQTAGFFDNKAWVPAIDATRYVPWPRFGHEIERLLTLTDALGLPRCGTHLEFPLGPEDETALTAAWPAWQSSGPYICVHPGAQLPSRRWPAQRFSAVADALASEGFTIVLTGAASELSLVSAVATAMRNPSVVLAGKTTLPALGALIQGASKLVCNDTGVSHIAAALHTPSVVISCGADVARWAPLDSQRHLVLWEAMDCRPCSYVTCPFEHGCATSISVAQVLDTVHAGAAKAAPEEGG